MKPDNLVLASSSKYRQNLLFKLNLQFSVGAPAIDETPLPVETAEQTSRRLSALKAQALQARFPAHLIIGSDQVAVCDGRLLTKPGDKITAIRQLQSASGNSMTFFTSVSVLQSQSGRILSATDRCTVFFRPLTLEQIEHYVDLEQPYDCAGGFKSEGLGVALLERIQGDDPNALIGLPLIKLLDLLERFGIRVV